MICNLNGHASTNHETSASHVTPAPLSSDSISVKRREDALANNKSVSMETANRGEHKRPVRVYIDGVFDLFHYGHAQCLRQAKLHFPSQVHLIVGVSSTEECLRNKRPPVMTSEERVACVRHCRYVDEVLAEAPWYTSPEFVALHAIDFVCHDAIPYKAADVEDLYAWMKERGIFFATERTPNISTTDLIERMKSMAPILLGHDPFNGETKPEKKENGTINQ